MVSNVEKKWYTENITLIFLLKEKSRKYVERSAERELIQRVKWDYESSFSVYYTLSDFLPLMIPISPHLCLFLIFSLLSLIPSPFIFLLPPLLSFFSLSPLFLSSLSSFILCSVGSIVLFHAFAYHLFAFVFVRIPCSLTSPLMTNILSFCFIIYLLQLCLFIYLYISPSSSLRFSQLRIRFIYIQPATSATEIY